MKKITTLSALLCLGFLATLMTLPAHSAEKRTVTGTIALWTKPFCENQTPCGFPKPLEISWSFKADYEVPLDEGGHVVVNQTLSQGEWTVHLLQVWINKKPDLPYLSTQARLSHKQMGFIAECNRYDAVTSYLELPPGSCSGRAQDNVYGMSFFLKPRN